MASRKRGGQGQCCPESSEENSDPHDSNLRQVENDLAYELAAVLRLVSLCNTVQRQAQADVRPIGAGCERSVDVPGCVTVCLLRHSSAEYYRIVNQAVRARRGGVHSARVLMWSFDFGEIEALQHAGRWDDAAALLVDAARRLEQGGADFALICTNTMHRMADAVQAAISIPLLHIADPTAERIRAAGLSRVGLLGTVFTMEQDFNKGRLADRFGLDVLVRGDEDRATVHRVIYDELVQGWVEPASRGAYRDVIARLVEHGAEAVILGCTEIMLLVRPEDSPVPLFDTTALSPPRPQWSGHS